MAFNNYYPYQQMLYPQIQQSYQPNIPNYGLGNVNNTSNPSGINGRIIDDISNININEVSSDSNNPSLFIKRDFSEIYYKKYNQNGLIETHTYKLFKEEPKTKEENSNVSIQPVLEMFQEKLCLIEEKLNKALSPTSIVNAPKTRSTKKEVEE